MSSKPFSHAATASRHRSPALTSPAPPIRRTENCRTHSRYASAKSENCRTNSEVHARNIKTAEQTPARRPKIQNCRTNSGAATKTQKLPNKLRRGDQRSKTAEQTLAATE